MSLILHHYPLSPFSEKIRAMLAYTNLEWTSCISSEVPPRDKLDLLTGGYGRIPVAQLGADVFCDSNLIAHEIARMAALEGLDPYLLGPSSAEKMRVYEGKFFFACINRAFSLGLLGRFAKEKGVVELFKFLKDRVQMGRSATISMGSPKSAPKIIDNTLAELEAELEQSGAPYIGGTIPGLLDFALYHGLWFIDVVGHRDIWGAHSVACAWYETMKQYQGNPKSQVSLDQALAIALRHEPKVVDGALLNSDDIGSLVSITPADYRRLPVEGILVGEDANRWVIQRSTAETGAVHVHFPKQGYCMAYA